MKKSKVMKLLILLDLLLVIACSLGDALARAHALAVLAREGREHEVLPPGPLLGVVLPDFRGVVLGCIEAKFCK